MTDKEIIIDGVDVLKEKINMCFILLINKLETPETIEQTIYEHLDAFVEEWNTQLIRKTQECEELERRNKLLLIKGQEGISKRAWAYEQCKKRENRYRKALEEIEQELKEDIYCESQECGCDDSEECLRCTKDLILNIINKAKGLQ